MALQTIYVFENPEDSSSQSIFLAGPSPREKHHPNWRLDALQILEKKQFAGDAFIPLSRDVQLTQSLEGQIEWELTYLDKASVIVFWVPRDLETLPGFTTNVEFGMYVKSGKIVLGFPKEAPHMRYLEHLAQINHVPTFYTLEETIEGALQFLKENSALNL